ncbi:Uncharacterised protein [Mycobacteroides abscessus]|nr:Uncharacterised protein [Mycobacteroides abscessus]SKU61107.1 Uncharacterised protein [Mycobacteroides abscessus subsp. abscessus]
MACSTDCSSSWSRCSVWIAAPDTLWRTKLSRMFPRSTGWGPSSRNTRYRSPMSVSTAFANKTLSRTFLHQ